MEPQPDPFISLIPYLFVSIILVFVAHLLAKEKGRNVTKWTLLACIPIFNLAFIWFSVGASNLKHEKMLEGIRESLDMRDKAAG